MSNGSVAVFLERVTPSLVGPERVSGLCQRMSAEHAESTHSELSNYWPLSSEPQLHRGTPIDFLRRPAHVLDQDLISYGAVGQHLGH